MKAPRTRRQILAFGMGISLGAIIPRAATATEQREFEVYFEEGSDQISQEGLDGIKVALDFVLAPFVGQDRDSLKIWVVVVGHASADENVSDKMELSKLRAWHVADKLVAMGVPHDKIAADWKGDTCPTTWTHGKTVTAANRYVSIDPSFP